MPLMMSSSIGKPDDEDDDYDMDTWMVAGLFIFKADVFNDRYEDFRMRLNLFNRFVVFIVQNLIFI